jgi:hypothetical protein
MSADLLLPVILFVIAATMPIVIVIQLLIIAYIRMLRQWKWNHQEPIQWPSPWTNTKGNQ